MRRPSSTTRGVADQLHHDVAAPVVGELLDARDAFRGRLVLAHVHGVGRAELAGQGQPLVDAVDRDDLARAHLARHRARVDAEPARALHDHRLAGAQPREVEAGVDLRVGAVDARGHLVADLRGQLEHGVIRPQVEVLAEAALEVGPHLAGHEPVGLARGAGLVLAPQAGLAAPAREEEAVEHAVADRERLPGGVGGDARAELGHGADVLVARY